MTKEEIGESRSRVQTEQSAPKEKSSISEEMKVSPMSTPPSGTRKILSLLECEVDVVSGETRYCRRIPIYDDPVAVPAVGGTVNVPSTPLNTTSVDASNEGCSPTNCSISAFLKKKKEKSNSQNTVGDSLSK